MKSQTDAASAKDESVTTEPKAAAVSEKQPASTAVTTLTVGEMVEKHLDPNRIGKKSKSETVVIHLSVSFFSFYIFFVSPSQSASTGKTTTTKK